MATRTDRNLLVGLDGDVVTDEQVEVMVPQEATPSLMKERV